MTAVELIDPRTDPRWARFVDAAQASVFHRSEWLQLLHRTYGYSLAACCIVSGGRVRAGLPLARVASPILGRRLVALPFSDVCEPVVEPASSVARDQLLAAVADLGARMRLEVEIRAPVAGLPGGRPAGQFLQHLLPLDADAAHIERRVISSSTRRGVAKARKGGLVAERHTSAWALAEFYRLHLRTRRRQGVPTQPRRFIMGLETLFQAGLGFMLLVRDSEQVIAAAVFLCSNGVADLQVRRLRRAAARRTPEQPAVHGGDRAGVARTASTRSTSGARASTTAAWRDSSAGGAGRSAR